MQSQTVTSMHPLGSHTSRIWSLQSCASAWGTTGDAAEILIASSALARKRNIQSLPFTTVTCG